MMNDELNKNYLVNWLFDGRIDKTKVLFEVDNGKTQCHWVIKEENYSVCDFKGNFLFHFTPDEATKDNSNQNK